VLNDITPDNAGAAHDQAFRYLRFDSFAHLRFSLAVALTPQPLTFGLPRSALKRIL
jgi:hypothetical protein